MPGKLIISADSSKAVQAMTALQGSMTEANQATELLGKGFNGLVSALDGIEQMAINASKMRVQMNQLGRDGVAQLMNMRRATDDLIEADQLMRARFALTRNGLKLTEEQFGNVLKAAVKFSRAGGEEVGIVLDRLAKGITGGTVSAVNDFGFALDESGTIADRQKRILEALGAKYKDVEISAKGAAEEATRSANAHKANMAMFTDERVKNIAKGWRSMKDGAKELAVSILTWSTAGDRQIRIMKEMRQSAMEVASEILQLRTQYVLTQDLLKSLRKGTIEYSIALEKQRGIVNQLITKEKERHSLRTAALNKEIEIEKKKLESAQKLIPWASEVHAKSQKNFKEQQSAIAKMLPWANKLNEISDNRVEIKAKLAKENKKHAASIKDLTKDVENLTNAYGDLGKKALMAGAAMLQKGMESASKWLAEGRAAYEAEAKAAEKRAKASKSAGDAEFKARQELRKQLRLQQELIAALGARATLEDRVALARLKHLLTLRKGARESFLEGEQHHDVIKNRWEAFSRKKDEDAAKKKQQLEEARKAETAYQQQVRTWQKNRWDALQAEALQRKKNIEAAKNQFVGAGATGALGDQLKEAERGLVTAKAQEDAAGIARAEKRIQLLRSEANQVGMLKTNYQGLFTVGTEVKGMIEAVGRTAISAAFMESSKLKEMGKTRAQVMKEAIADMLKAKAIEYGVKALGTAAEATAALFIPGLQGTAAGLFKAAGLYSAAAIAAGGASMALKKSSSSGGAGKGAETQAPASMGQEKTGQTIVINISESVLGEPDAVASSIQRMISAGQERGAVDQWA